SGFADHDLLTPRGALTVATAGDEDKLDYLLEHSTAAHPIEETTVARALDLCPLLRPETPSRTLYEAGVMDMDVAAIHQGFLKGLKARGGRLAVAQQAISVERQDAKWQVATRDARF